MEGDVLEGLKLILIARYNVPALTSPYGQKDTSACELVASAAGSNIYTLTLGL